MKKKNIYTLPLNPFLSSSFSVTQFLCILITLYVSFFFYRNLLDRDTFSKSDPSKNIFLLPCCSNAYCTMKYAYQTLKNIQKYLSYHGLL